MNWVQSIFTFDLLQITIPSNYIIYTAQHFVCAFKQILYIISPHRLSTDLRRLDDKRHAMDNINFRRKALEPNLQWAMSNTNRFFQKFIESRVVSNRHQHFKPTIVLIDWILGENKWSYLKDYLIFISIICEGTKLIFSIYK